MAEFTQDQLNKAADIADKFIMADFGGNDVAGLRNGICADSAIEDFVREVTRPAPKADSALVGGDVVGMLRKAAAEMRSAHHAGWPNVCDVAADTLAALSDRDVVLEEAA